MADEGRGLAGKVRRTLIGRYFEASQQYFGWESLMKFRESDLRFLFRLFNSARLSAATTSILLSF